MNECRALFKHKNYVYDFHGELTQLNIQHLYLNYTNKLMTFAFILYESMENKFHMITIVKS